MKEGNILPVFADEWSSLSKHVINICPSVKLFNILSKFLSYAVLRKEEKEKAVHVIFE